MAKTMANMGTNFLNSATVIEQLSNLYIFKSSDKPKTTRQAKDKMEKAPLKKKLEMREKILSWNSQNTTAEKNKRTIENKFEEL